MQECDATWGFVLIESVEQEQAMGGISRRRIGGVAVTGLVVAGVAAFSSFSASGESTPVPATGPAYIPYGTLTINLTDSTGTYELKDPDGTIIQTELIDTSNPCAAVIEDSGLLLNVAPTSPQVDTVQIRNSAFGVNTGNTSCGASSAAVISGSEKLTIDLGPYLTNAEVFAKSASLQVTQVKKGNLRVALDDTAFPVPDIESSPQTISVTPSINSTQDLFTRIAFTSTSNKDNEGVSLATGTTFELVKPDPNFDTGVNCNEFVEVPSTGDVATNATYLRLDNKTSVECKDVGVRVEIQESAGTTPGRVFWNNSFTPVGGGSTQTVQAYFTIVWAPTNDLTKLERVIDYDGDGTAQSSPVPMQWCAAEDPAVPGFPTLPASPAGGIGINVGTVEAPDWRAPWCLVNDDRALQGDGTIVQTQKLFGSGDPWAR